MCVIIKRLFKEKKFSVLKIIRGNYNYSRKKTPKVDGCNESRKDEMIGNQSKETRCANESHLRKQSEKKCLGKFDDSLGEIEDECERNREKIDNKFANERQNLYRQDSCNIGQETGYMTQISTRDQPEKKEKKNLNRLSPADRMQPNENESSRCNFELNAHLDRNGMAGCNICNCYDRHKTVGLIDVRNVESGRDNVIKLNETIDQKCTEYRNEFYGAEKRYQRLVTSQFRLEHNTVHHRNEANPQSQQTPDSIEQSGAQNQSEGILRIKKFDTKQSFDNNLMDYDQKQRSESFNKMPKHPNTISKARTQNHHKSLVQQYLGFDQELEYNRAGEMTCQREIFERIDSTQSHWIKKRGLSPVGSINLSFHHDGLGAAPGPSILEQTSLTTPETQHSARHPFGVVYADNRDKNSSQSRDLDNKAVSFGGNIWSEDVENAFLEAIAIYPLNGCKRIKKDKDSPLCGRNSLISEYIYERTGKLRTNKQISSHIQVLKRRHPEKGCNWTHDDSLTARNRHDNAT